MNSFTNDLVEPASLPKAEETSLQPIESSYRKILVWEWMIGWGIILLAAIITILLIPAIQNILWIAVIAVAISVFGLLNLWLMLKSFSRKAYALRDKDLIYRSGWMIQRFSVCPFNRIQHCSVSAGPLERRFGLASISVYTAGTEGSDMKISGLREADAFAIRDFIMKKTGTDEQPGI